MESSQLEHNICERNNNQLFSSVNFLKASTIKSNTNKPRFNIEALNKNSINYQTPNLLKTTSKESPKIITNEDKSQAKPSGIESNINISEILQTGYDLGLSGLKGGAAGLLSGGPIPYTMTMLAKDVIHKYPESIGAKSAKWYLEHFDKKTILDNRNKVVQKAIDEDTKKIGELAAKDGQELDRHLTYVRNGLFGQIDFEKIDYLEKRTKWLSNSSLLDKSLAKKNVLELEDLFKTEPKMFSKEEFELLLKRQKAVLDSAKLEKEMLEAEKVFGGKAAMIKNFSIGAGFDMGEFALNDFLQKYDKGTSLLTKWSTNLLFVPAEEFMPGGIYTKLAYGAAIIGGSQALEYFMPNVDKNSFEYKILKPNNLDAILLAGACVMPVDGAAMRLALMGLSVIPGRIENYFSSK